MVWMRSDAHEDTERNHRKKKESIGRKEYFARSRNVGLWCGQRLLVK